MSEIIINSILEELTHEIYPAGFHDKLKLYLNHKNELEAELNRSLTTKELLELLDLYSLRGSLKRYR